MHIVHTEADGGKGGQPLRIINESLGMIQRGHQVTLLCPETAPLHALARNAGLTVVTMPLKRKNLKNLQVPAYRATTGRPAGSSARPARIS